MKKLLFYLFMLSLCPSTLIAGETDVLDVKARYNSNNNFQIITTVKHDDTGWDHYVNAWVIMDMQGNVLGRRVLHHPHVNEQPFTRSHTLDIPSHVKAIKVKAIDSVHGGGGREMTITLKR